MTGVRRSAAGLWWRTLDRTARRLRLTVYQGAHHGFNFAMLQPGQSSLGHWLEYNEPAARDSEAKVRAFLAANLGTAAAEAPTSK